MLNCPFARFVSTEPIRKESRALKIMVRSRGHRNCYQDLQAHCIRHFCGTTELRASRFVHSRDRTFYMHMYQSSSTSVVVRRS